MLYQMFDKLPGSMQYLWSKIPPYCFGCDTLFTVRHFLLECGDFSHIRNKYFHVDTIKQLFNDVPIDNVFLFLKEINLFNKL